MTAICCATGPSIGRDNSASRTSSAGSFDFAGAGLLRTLNENVVPYGSSALPNFRFAIPSPSGASVPGTSALVCARTTVPPPGAFAVADHLHVFDGLLRAVAHDDADVGADRSAVGDDGDGVRHRRRKRRLHVAEEGRGDRDRVSPNRATGDDRSRRDERDGNSGDQCLDRFGHQWVCSTQRLCART